MEITKREQLEKEIQRRIDLLEDISLSNTNEFTKGKIRAYRNVLLVIKEIGIK